MPNTRSLADQMRSASPVSVQGTYQIISGQTVRFGAAHAAVIPNIGGFGGVLDSSKLYAISSLASENLAVGLFGQNRAYRVELASGEKECQPLVVRLGSLDPSASPSRLQPSLWDWRERRITDRVMTFRQTSVSHAFAELKAE